MNQLRTILTGILLSALLAGCAMPLESNMLSQAPIEPQAGQWETWVLSSSAELRPEAPPDETATADELDQLRALLAANDEQAKAQVLYWDAGIPTYRWVNLALERFSSGPPNPRVAPGMALLNIAIYDAIVATWEAKYTYNRPQPRGVVPLIAMPASPSYPSEHAASGRAAASTVLAYLFPEQADYFLAQGWGGGPIRPSGRRALHQRCRSRPGIGTKHRRKGRRMGGSRGSDAEWTGTIPTGPDKWFGENPVTAACRHMADMGYRFAAGLFARPAACVGFRTDGG